MKGIYSKNNRWYYNFMLKGKRYHKAIPEASCQKEAEEYLMILKGKILAGESIITKNRGKMAFTDLTEIYMKYSRAKKSSSNSDDAHIKRFEKFFQRKQIRSIKAYDIEEFLEYCKKVKKQNGKPLSNTTINKGLEILKKMFNIAIDNDLIEKNPCKGVTKLKQKQHVIRYLTVDEEKRLFEKCKGRNEYLRNIMKFALLTGCRKSEILNLKWDNVILDLEYINIVETKSNKNRQIPLVKELKNILSEMSENKISEYVFTNPDTLANYKDISKSFNTLCKNANVKNFRFHDFRHTAGTRLTCQGVDIASVKDILGHADVSTTMRYSHAVPKKMRRAMDGLSEFKGY